VTREAGVLLSISSLPSKEGIGTLGESAYQFADFLSKCGYRVWQVLPLTPTREGNSPYSSVSACALNPLFIDLYDLAGKGLLREEEISSATGNRVDYKRLRGEKEKALRLAFSRFDLRTPEFLHFEQEGVYREYAVFSALSEHFGNKPFYEWTDGFDLYNEERVESFVREHHKEYLYHIFTQFVFDNEWRELKAYVNRKGIKLFGDMPIYLAMNSAEVYFHPEMFLFDGAGRPVKIAGVPPDYFNEEGQLWGNPLYDWARMEKDGYRWWRARIDRELRRFDILRIDHFRGLDRFYAVDVDAKDAKHGVWMPGPGAALFEGMLDRPIVAEDLGYIDSSLHKMLESVGFPGMKVYEFGLDGDPWSEHKPANYKENVVAYTGTHDNMPFRGYLDSLEGSARAVAAKDILVQATVLGVETKGLTVPGKSTHNDGAERVIKELQAPYPADKEKEKEERLRRVYLIEGAPAKGFDTIDPMRLTEIAYETLLSSEARLAVAPMQDLLLLGEESRMNTPALVSEENWAWRLDPTLLTDRLIDRLRTSLEKTNRAQEN